MSLTPIAVAFARVAERFPQRLALLRHGREGLTYHELRTAAGDLADRLRQAGQGAGSRIVLELEDGPEFVAAVWACWELGAAFAPLPPSLPNLRRHRMLRIVRPECSIAAGAVPAVLDDAADCPSIAVSVPLRPWPAEADPAGTLADPEPPTFGDFPHACESIAYWIFTSGSTGEPKAVEVTHRGLLPMLLEQVAAFGLRPGCRVLRQLSILFDANLSDLGTTLLAGGTLCFEDAGVFGAAGRLRQTLISRRITHWDVPPSLLPLLADEPLPPNLETLVCGGEPADPACVRKLAGRVRFVNVYGPTEVTICTSLCRCDETWERPLLGSPVAGNLYRVCDSDGSETGVGESGELWISGPGLANGYRDRPDLTAARFPTLAGRRWFRTGDLVRRTVAGETEFLGRLDRQFKRRGRLICPEEIEAALTSHPAVGAACVLPPAGPGLVAVWEAIDPQAVAPTPALRRHLRERLPEWMIPTRLRRVPRLPRTDSGKVDLTKVVYYTEVAASNLPQETADPACESLRAIWRAVLEIEEVPLDADFTELGGDSVSALLIAARAAAVGLPLDPADLFRLRTVRECVAAGPTGGIVDFELEIKAQALAATLPPVRSDRLRRIPPDAPILLTGASGLFGGQLLRTLLRDTAAPIIVLLRDTPGRSAESRWSELSQSLPGELLTAARDRVEVVAGDVSQSNWGLPADFPRRVGRVIHAAAELSLARVLDDVLPTNAASFLPPARWAIEEEVEVHLISTLAVFVAAENAGGTYSERPLSPCGRRLCGCYAQSKWVAERAVAAVLGPEVPLFVHRFSLLANLHEPQPRLPDQLALWLAGLARIGCLPPPPEGAINLLPLDVAAELFARLVCGGAGERNARIFHWAARGNIAATELLAACRGRIASTQTVSQEYFRARLTELPAGDDTAVGLAGLGFDRGGRFRRAWDPFLSTRATFDVSCTEAALRTLGRSLPTAAEIVARLAAFHSAPTELR